MATLALTLMVLALVGGVIAGALAAWHGQRMHRELGLWPSFGAYVGVMTVVSTTFSQSMEILPVALLYVAAAGVAPFAAAFLATRAMVRTLLARRAMGTAIGSQTDAGTGKSARPSEGGEGG